jgi:hypothetical protein
LANVQDGVLHHKVDESQELLELTKLISRLGFFLDVEPAFTDLFERVLDDLA